MTNAWHEVDLAQDVPVGTLQKVEVEGKAVCVGRAAGGWVAFQDECTHEECSLADGELDGSGDRLPLPQLRVRPPHR